MQKNLQESMQHKWKIENNGGPIIAAAVHNGHDLEPEILTLLGPEIEDRLREEDPYTGIWTGISDSKIIFSTSRFEFDVNRPRDGAVYITPEQGWGLKIWKQPPSKDIIDHSLSFYDRFYSELKILLDSLLAKHKKLFIYDLHTYNHRREGPDGPVADPKENPEINLGTGNISMDTWRPLVDRFASDLKNFVFLNRHLDVRENVKFKGGGFSKWIHDNYGDAICCIAIEFKKIFMDEWTGKPDPIQLDLIKELLASAIPGIKDELKKAGGSL